MAPVESERTEIAAAQAPRRSLSWRVMWFTLAAMVAVELLLFLPAMQRERQKWLEGRLLAAQIAVQALPSAPGQLPPFAGPERAAREELLRLAGVLSVRLQEPGRPMVTLAPVGQIHAPALLDMRSESAWARLWATLSALTRSGDRLLLVVAPSPKRPQAVLSVVLREGELDNHLKEAAATVALHGLSVAIPTGILVHVTLLVLLVRPMRRLTQSIAAFRADPERTPPLEEPRAAQETRDEMVLAQRELAAMQRELRAALWRNARLAALGAALARVSHDLRGILTPALLTAERLQGNTDPALRRVGDSIARTVERATELVRNTLEFAGEVPAAPRERVALRDLVQEVAEEVRTRHPLLRVDVRIDAGLVAHGDRASLRRALANLIRNAAEAGARRVAVSAVAEGELAVVTLEDDGPGLPEVVRSSLFQPFVTSGKKGGTGLGLAITRDLVRAQGGEIGLVRSTAEGSVFRLALRMPGAEATEQRSAAG
jgi:signal transduction histidine kinase